MEFKFTRLSRIYFIGILSLLTLFFVAGTIYYWHSGAFNSDNISSVFEASGKIEEMEKAGQLKQVLKLVESDRAREAVPLLQQFEEVAKRIDSSASSDNDEYDKLSDSLEMMQEAMTGMVAVPEVKSIVHVFSERVDQFVSYVKENNWKTLSRISSRVQSRIDANALRQPGFYSFERMTTLKRALLEDLRNMRTVTEGSVLSPEFKNAIYEKLEGLKTEVVMLDKYLVALDQFSRASQVTLTHYGKWSKAIAPSVALDKMSMERNSQSLIYGAIAAIALLLLSLGVSIPVHSYLTKMGEREFEDRVINLIRKGILPFESQVNALYGSPAFLNELSKCHDYVHKRMSFGTIFQEAMPFSSLLLDSNLNLIWANSEFYRDWGMEGQSLSSSSTVTWDYLQRFTNLGEEDPVMLAHREGVAGIYQIQVKTESSPVSLPYEMYVSPVEYSGQTRIMVMFYPLRSMEETMGEQTRSIVTPVARTIDALSQNAFTPQFAQEIAHDFENAGIGDLLASFTSYKELVDLQEQGLVDNIGQLEGKLVDQYKLNDDLKKVIVEQGDTLQQMMESLKSTKSSIISSLELRGKVEDHYLETMKVVNDLFYEQDDLINEAKLAHSNLTEQAKVFRNMKALRNDYREMREEINSFRSLLAQDLNQLMVSGRINNVNEQLDASLERMKDDVKRFDKSLGLLAQVMQQTDISLSKLELMMQQTKEPDFTRYIETFSEIRQTVEREVKGMTVLSGEGRECEDMLVSALKEQFALYKETVNKMRFMQELLSDNYQRNSDESVAEYTPGPEMTM